MSAYRKRTTEVRVGARKTRWDIINERVARRNERLPEGLRKKRFRGETTVSLETYGRVRELLSEHLSESTVSHVMSRLTFGQAHAVMKGLTDESHREVNCIRCRGPLKTELACRLGYGWDCFSQL
jgi:hypothetical protein